MADILSPEGRRNKDPSPLGVEGYRVRGILSENATSNPTLSVVRGFARKV
jgi:hypothetical protein